MNKGKLTNIDSGNVHSQKNILLIWLDSNIDENNDDCKNTLDQLRDVINNLKTFTDGERCVEFVKTINKEKACMIISGSLGQHLVHRVHELPQIDSILIFCGDRKRHEVWAKEWPKIKGVFTKIARICEKLRQSSTPKHDSDTASFCLLLRNGDSNNENNLDQLECSFMYTQILKEIFLTINFNEKHFQEFIKYSRKQFADDDSELKRIEKLQKEYREQTPIRWYTWHSFLYTMVNGALRNMNVVSLVTMGFFINDLHRDIERRHLEQLHGHQSRKTFKLYRGQNMPKVKFDEIKKTKDGLIAFNNFLSTTEILTKAREFIDHSPKGDKLVDILFVMTIDPSESTTPFASIADISHYPDEQEVLFSMHSVFRIQDIKQIDNNDRLYQVDLTLTSDDDKDLRLLTKRISEELKGSIGWYRLGQLLRKMGQFDKAEEVYQILLDESTNKNEKASIYHQLGWIKDHQGKYPEAIQMYKKSLTIYQETLPANHLDLAASYNNIGMVYNKMGDYETALSYYLKDLDISKNLLPADHLDLAFSYNNIGVVYDSMGDYEKALKYYLKAAEIKEKSLSSNHPDLGGSYNNIGLVYYKIDDYSKALSYCEKALKNQQKALPPDHPGLGGVYYNMGLIYETKNELSKARSFYQQAADIARKSLPENHPDRKLWSKKLEDIKTKV